MEKSTKSLIERGELTAGTNISYWTDSSSAESYPKLNADIETDVVIVGGGNSGLSIAYRLMKAGKSVVLVEDGFIGSGETGRTSAHLTAVLDSSYFKLEKIYGSTNTKLIAESHMKAISFIEMTTKAENIECDFQRVSGYLFLHPTDKPETLQKELAAATEAGLEVIYHENTPGLKNPSGPCLEFTCQAKFHPMKYIKGLAEAITKMGGRIFINTHAKEIDETGVTSREGYRVTAKHIVVATNSPVNNKYLMHLRQYPYRSYVIGACVKKDSVLDALYWDTGDQNGNVQQAYHYLRTQPYNENFDLLICGGEDHATGLAEADNQPAEQDRYRKLEKWVRERFDIEQVMYEWSGQILYAFDALGYIGRNPMDRDNIYIVTGDNGNGLTYGTIAGLLITDLISGTENEFEEIYKPARFKFLQAGNVFIEELVTGLAAYFKSKPRETSESIQSIKAGEGKIIEIEGKKYGAFRSFDEYVHIVASECTHLGCSVKWNGDEKSWDCPCHGSRFTTTGTVVNGPANTNLNHHKIHESEFENIKSHLK
ncbi:MAG: FAD-dependent oxidoreductase [Bacteroidota bacterium]|nr:FAD-dependent oxidoreductase [Bacteroidota bacterium]